MASSCIKMLDGEIVLSDVRPETVNGYVRRTCSECYELTPNIEIKDVVIRLVAPMLLGIRPRKQTILLPFTKVCQGTMLFEVPVTSEDIRVIRALFEGTIGVGGATTTPYAEDR